jgi:hypothetical protein
MAREENKFDTFADLILSAGANLDPSELHGFVCGVLAAGARPDTGRWQRELGDLLDLDAVPADLNQDFLRLAEESLTQLRDNNFSFQPLLDEDADVAERSAALGFWCQGFLHGFGVGKYQGELPPTSSEALRDLAAIARVDAEQIDESDEAETQLAEVQEYVRMAALTIFTECGGSGTESPTLH